MEKVHQLDTSCIYDFETLSQDGYSGVVVSLALLNFNPLRFEKDPYTFFELIDKSFMIKFDVKEQVKEYNRKIDPDSLKWWGEQNETARKMIAPSKDDESISKLYDFFILNTSPNLKRVYTRNNTFDPIFLEYTLAACGKPMPYDFWKIRDTKSLLEGMTWGTDFQDNFIPDDVKEHFVPHDPVHDVAMDVMRIQHVSRIILGND